MRVQGAPFIFKEINHFHHGIYYNSLQEFDDTGLLNGSTGIALSLFSCSADITAMWQEIFFGTLY